MNWISRMRLDVAVGPRASGAPWSGAAAAMNGSTSTKAKTPIRNKRVAIIALRLRKGHSRYSYHRDLYSYHRDPCDGSATPLGFQKRSTIAIVRDMRREIPVEICERARFGKLVADHNTRNRPYVFGQR